MYKAGLFDLDGVVFDTEGLYSEFWRSQFQKYLPQSSGLELKIKGQTLTWIFDKYFAGLPEVQSSIQRALGDFESTMPFPYVKGFEAFIRDMRLHGLKTALVTSSNHEKMSYVAHRRPELQQYFDRILTAEDFSKSKPNPDGYLKAAASFGLPPQDCLVFEDSFNGLRAGRAAGATVVGLATTNSMASVRPLCDVAVNNYVGLDYEGLLKALTHTAER